MKKIFLILLSFVLFAFISCGSSKVEEKSTQKDWISFSEENSNQNFGYFYTSDELGRFSSLEVEFKKDSGFESSCFGLIFGYSKTENGILSNYVRFEINTLGEYALYTWDGSNFSDLIDSSAKNTAYLTENASILKGYGSINKLKIEVDSENRYSCFINDSKIASSIIPFENTDYSAMAFFSVGKSDEENFPDSPVQVSYRLINSAAYTSEK